MEVPHAFIAIGAQQSMDALSTTVVRSPASIPRTVTTGMIVVNMWRASERFSAAGTAVILLFQHRHVLLFGQVVRTFETCDPVVGKGGTFLDLLPPASLVFFTITAHGFP